MELWLWKGEGVVEMEGVVRGSLVTLGVRDLLTR
jgi:hypothetical protein